MRLGAFLQYNKYTVGRHQQVGRSTCRVHPCKQENRVKPVPVQQQIPLPVPHPCRLPDTHTHTHTHTHTTPRRAPGQTTQQELRLGHLLQLLWRLLLLPFCIHPPQTGPLCLLVGSGVPCFGSARVNVRALTADKQDHAR